LQPSGIRNNIGPPFARVSKVFFEEGVEINCRQAFACRNLNKHRPSDKCVYQVTVTPRACSAGMYTSFDCVDNDGLF